MEKVWSQTRSPVSSNVAIRAVGSRLSPLASYTTVEAPGQCEVQAQIKKRFRRNTSRLKLGGRALPLLQVVKAGMSQVNRGRTPIIAKMESG